MKIFCVIASAALISCRLNAQTNAEVSPVATNQIKAETPAPRAPTIIHSHIWAVDNVARRMTYSENVQVDDPQMKLTCAWLVADLPESGHINHIVAETNVVIDFVDDKGQTNHATSDKAIYDFSVKDSTTNETVTLTGNAKVESPQGTLTGEPIIWNRAINQFTSTNFTMIFRQSLNDALIKTNSPALAKTNTVSTPK
ncbi:MAG TPA: LptA/OstA family protein [Verrucomicrobiae bacterium]|nr:LptA/OstA family protein [Verrucomicrobiae bacterium]